MIKIITTLTNKGQDAEMAAQGADFYFMLPMYQIGRAEIAENLCGIQRTYLKFSEDKYQSAQKVGRAMLGKKGVTSIAPIGNPVILPESGPVIGSGEGFETVASFVQNMRRPGVVTWDWSGLKAWSEAIVPGLESPTVAFLVDHDKSETGQRESAAGVRRIMAHEHGKAVYLLPPETIQPDSKGNRDWNDLLRQSPDQFAAEIIHAWHKSDENLALAPVCPDAPTLQKGPRDAEVAQAIAEAVERYIAYLAAEKAAKEYLPSYMRHVEELQAWKDVPKEKKLKRPKLPPLLIKVTTGVGKSHLIRELIKHESFKDVPMLILTRTHELAEDYSVAGAFQYHGRAEPFLEPVNGLEYTEQDMKENGDKFHDNTCFKYPVVRIVSENNHVPALTACRSCEHGRKYMLENYDEASQPFADAKSWFSGNGFTDEAVDQVPACLWLGHQKKAAEMRVVVAPNASYSETLATWTRDDGEKIPRLVIVDEIPDLTKSIGASSADLGVHARKCLDLMEFFSGKISNLRASRTEAPGLIEDLNGILDDLKAGHGLMRGLAKAMGDSVGAKGLQRLPDDLVKQIKALDINWLPGATARWEKAEIRYGHEAFVPLRIAKAIVQSVSTGTAVIEAGKLHVQEITTLGDRIKKGTPSILLDATPSQAIEFMVNKRGGQIVDAIAKQHVKIVHYNQYLHGRSWKNKEHQQQELAALVNLKDQMTEETGASPVVLTYMPHCELAEKSDDGDWGYFGRDDIGQDSWKSRDMLIFGGPLFSPVTQALSYNSELMLKRLAGDKTAPDWSTEIERGAGVTVGNKVITAKAPLPADPALREWVLHDYGRRMAQGIGRARAVWASEDKPINIWIAGGLPLAGLAAHGLEVSEYREEKQNMNDESQQRTEEKVQAAMATRQAADQDTGYRGVQKELERMGLPGCRYDAWKRVQTVYGLDNDTYKGVDALLKALQSIADAARICGCDLSDIARDRIAAGDSLPEVHRLAAQLVLEASTEYAGDWPNPENAPS
ncbi:MAG: toprim domain-containing protein [Acidithiobacillus sp.]|nr:toprim domain-containing protein [Acidithiobacillus sp.]